MKSATAPSDPQNWTFVAEHWRQNAAQRQQAQGDAQATSEAPNDKGEKKGKKGKGGKGDGGGGGSGDGSVGSTVGSIAGGLLGGLLGGPAGASIGASLGGTVGGLVESSGKAPSGPGTTIESGRVGAGGASGEEMVGGMAQSMNKLAMKGMTQKAAALGYGKVY